MPLQAPWSLREEVVHPGLVEVEEAQVGFQEPIYHA